MSIVVVSTARDKGSVAGGMHHGPTGLTHQAAVLMDAAQSGCCTSGLKPPMNLHVIYTESEMLLSKKPYVSWHEIQDEFPSYKTSLGPCTAEEMVEYLAEEYPQLASSAMAQMQVLLTGACETIGISAPSPTPTP